jgi:2-amino-4-hydroxy-6-hydroxymethyldihydropteridine diphosphokinase
MKANKTYLSLGGNLGNVYDRLKEAIYLLKHDENIKHVRTSHFYLTSPVEMTSEHPFINTACCFETTLTLKALFSLTQSIEQKLGKVKKPKNADRPIDIDILFFGYEQLHTEEITIPHPRWKERLFVLIPLQELTNTITFSNQNYLETIVIQDLIDPLIKQSLQDISLLEKNPHIQ